jgi:hypothetical protein
MENQAPATGPTGEPPLGPPRRARYFVSMGMSGGWLIFKEGTQQAVHALESKLLAIETAKTMARDDAPSEVLVERRDGSFYRHYAFDYEGDPGIH